MELTYQNYSVGTGNYNRERRAAREARAGQLFSKPVTFISRLGQIAKSLVSGEKLTVPNSKGELSIARLDSLRCAICGDIHGQPSKNDREWKSELLAKTGVFRSANGDLFVLSETCVIGTTVDGIHKAGYVESRFMVNPSILTNADTFTKDYNLTLPNVKVSGNATVQAAKKA